jgi:hypothetical protein
MGDDAVVFDWLPGHQLKASDSTVQVPLRFARWSKPGGASLTLKLRWGDKAPAAKVAFQAKPFETIAISGASVAVPESTGKHTLVAEVTEGQGSRVCANWIEVVVGQ